MTLVQNKDANSETPHPRPSSPSGFDWNALRRKLTEWCRRALCRKRVVWLALGLAAAAATALGELSQLLADIASEGAVSYSAAVFTSFTFAPVEAGHEFADAVRLWCPSDGLSPCWLGYVDLYVWINVVVLAPSLTYLLYRVMLEVGLSRIESGCTVAALLLLNFVEKVSTVALVHLHADDSWYALPRFFSLLKWIGIAGALAITIGGWSSKKILGSSSLQRERGQDAEQAGSHLRTATTLAGPIIVLALFLTLVALPAGGPLDQLPDVVRNQLSELFEQRNPEPFVGSVIGLLLFFLALLVATTWTTYMPNCGAKERKAAPTTWRIIAITLVVGLALLAVELILGGPSLWVSAVPLGLVGGLAVVDCVVRQAVDRRVQPSSDDKTALDDKTAIELKTTDKAMRLASSWAPILPALAVMGSGIGLLRATFKPLVLGIHPELPWIFGVVFAIVVTVFAGAFTEWICRRRLKINKRENNLLLRVLQIGAVVLIVGVAAALAVQPDWAKWLTSGGTVAVCLGLVALGVGALHNVSQRREPWGVTARLGLGRVRTPCVGIIAITWLVAVVVNGSGGYHNIDVYQNGRDATYASPSAAVQAWLTQAVDQTGHCVDPIGSQPGTARSVIKMIMVAAPGGGIRAAYWTASGLDAMTKSTACGAGNIFAVSGVSGGSIGTAAWLASLDGNARDTVKALATDDALAASTASLFLRDLPQPFSGGSTRWRDRTEVMQDVMTSEARAFGTVEEPALFSGSPAHAGWRPAVVFNGSSVTDGCRVLVTNVAQLPAGPSPCEPAAGKGAIPGSLDAMAGADENLRGDGTTCNVASRGDMPLLTAALLSARFPVISPVGIFDRCAGPSGATDGTRRVNTTYDLDGGYYENSGLLSLLQFWDAVRPTIQRCNEQAARPSPKPTDGTQASGCPNAAAHIQIQPWIVVLDNHYESSASAPPAPRQDELSLPVQALMNSNDIVGQANLEETARVAMRTFPLAPAGGDTGMFARIGPSMRPTVEAPLGWVLSQTARCGLDEQLQTYRPVEPVLDPGQVQLSTDCPSSSMKSPGG